jgi:hypothetical protein
MPTLREQIDPCCRMERPVCSSDPLFWRVHWNQSKLGYEMTEQSRN